MANINQWKVGDIISASKLNEMVNAINDLLQQEIPEIDTSNLITHEQLTTILAGYSDVGHTHNISEIVDLVLPTVPTKLSQLENDAGYLTEHQDISNKADKSEIPTKLSQLTNDTDYATITQVNQAIANAQLGGGEISELNIMSLILGNYQIKYNSTDDTLDFIFNGVIDEPDVPSTPTTEEVVPLTWAVGNLSSTGAEKPQENALRSSFAAIEDNYDYSFYLDTSFYDPTGVRVYFYDTNKTFISRTDGNVLGYTSGTDISIDMPSNTGYIRFKANASGTTSVDTIGSLFTLKKANDEIVIPTWNDGKSIAGATGGIIANEAAMVTDPIAIDNNYNYTIRYNPTTTNEIRIAYYDSSQSFISRSDYLTSGNEDTLITFPANTAYFRIKSEKVGITVNEANNNIIIKKVKKVNKVNSYVTEGLSLYIDATRSSISDITGNHTITNHGVTHTSDNNYLNFVASESDYLDTDFTPNLTTWSAEVYFYFTETPTSSQSIVAWGGTTENRLRITRSGTYKGLAVQSNNEPTRVISDKCNLLIPHHLIVTMNNGALTSYLDGVKTVLCTQGGTQGSHSATLKIGTKYDVSEDFANLNLRTFRFYDGKVLTDEEALQNYKYELKNNYVTNGLSLYIDAQDVATQGSVRDITGKQSIVNHGVSTTLDNGCLNFVASESDYIDGGFKPNLTKWSAEAYFYFTATPTSAETVLGWGASGNRTAIGIWGNTFMIAINGNVEHTIMPTAPTSLTHIVLTYNNGTIIAYVNGAKSQIATNANVMSSQAGNLMIGTKYSASGEFGNIHLKSLRFYDGKVLTEEEALQNYNYEINRGIIKPTWIYNKKPNSSTGELVDGENNACTEFIPYDSSYNYTLAIDTVAFFRVFYYDSSQSYIKNDSIADNFNGVITPPENTAYMRLKLGRSNLELTDLDNHVIFRKSHK